MEFVFVFLLGTAVGSFLNVCIYRLPRAYSLVRPPSRCSFCGHSLAWYDNLPLLSFLWLGGLCRQCRVRISWRYPGIELFTGLLFLLCYFQLVVRVPGYPRTWDLSLVVAFWLGSPSAVWACLVGWGFLSALVAATFIDFDFQIIPDSITLGGLGLAVVVSVLFPKWHQGKDFLLEDLLLGGVFQWFFGADFWSLLPSGALEWRGQLQGLIRSGFGAAVGAGLVWTVGVLGRLLFRKEAMGFGDVKFNAMVGALLGWQVALGTLLLGAVFGAVGGVLVLVRTRQTRMPFGPYLSLAAGLFFLFPETLLALPEWWTGWLARHLPL